jgi:hypothetical protein
MANDFTCRPYGYRDYEMLCEWWREHGRVPVPETFLPQIGFIAGDGDWPLAAAWLFFDTTTPVCFVGHAVTRPKLSVEQSSHALVTLVQKLKWEALLSNAVIMAAYLPRGMARYLPEFSEDDRSLDNLSLVLTEEEICHS